MNRRDAIKNMTLYGAGMFLPTKLFSVEQTQKHYHYIGLGSAGSRLVGQLYNKRLKGSFTCINDTREPELPSDVGFIRFIAPEPDKIMFGHKFYEVSDIQKDWGVPQDILALVDGDERYVILAGLGRFTGSYLSMQLSGLLSDESKNHIMVYTLPFSFEGRGINNIAKYTHERIREHSETMTCNLDDITGDYGYIGLNDAFRNANEKVCLMLIMKSVIKKERL